MTQRSPHEGTNENQNESSGKLSVEQHRQASALFLQALEQAAERRTEFVRERSCNDPDLGAEVLSWLAHDSGGPYQAGQHNAGQHTAGLLQASAAGLSAADFCPPAHTTESSLPRSIGPYTILEELGHGASSVVYGARQQQPQRDVALKVLHTIPGQDQLALRLAFEGEILARLDHPGIAHVYACGSEPGPGGQRPWIAMEWVRGQPLTAWLDAHRSDIPTRVRLLAAICDGVHHAHLRGVIHRDLKPDNILVDEQGQPKVLDFGVARAARRLGDPATLLSSPGQLLGTLQTMSPEQVGDRPEHVDLRSDIYALGTTAYRVLSGVWPHELTDLGPASAAKIIAETLPPALESHDSELAGPLSAIVSTAMAKDPEDRYPSAANLATDLRAWLAGEPVSARPEPSWRRAQRLTMRHPWLASGALMILLGMLVVIAVQRRDAQALTRQTTALRQASTALADLLASTAADRWRGEETVDELMNRVDVAVPHFARGNVGLEGALWSLVGRYHGHSDNTPQHRRLALAAYRKGVALQTQAYGARDPRALSATIDLAEFLERHGHVDHAAALLADYEHNATGVFAPHDERHLAALLIKGRTAALRGELQPAAALLTRIARGTRAELGEGHEFVVTAAGLLYSRCHEPEQLELSLAKLTQHITNGLIDEHSLRAVMGLSGHLLARRRNDDTSRALTLRQHALSAYDQRFGADDLTGRLYWNLHATGIPMNRKQRQDAECILRRSLSLFERKKGPAARETLLTAQQLAEHLGASARFHEPRRTQQPQRQENARDRAEAELLGRRVLSLLPQPPERALELHTRATVHLAQLLLEAGQLDQAEAQLLALDACRDRLFDHEPEGYAPQAPLLAQLFSAKGQLAKAAAVAAAVGTEAQQP
ncbi:MAG: hypothetical protein ACI9EF_001643 [Pseudohongiellaceae bacterium]|jgi:hypothetical protein